MIVNADAVNVRNAPTMEAAVMQSLRKGTEVVVLSRDGGWAHIRVNDLDGWVRSSLLTATGQAAPTTGGLQQPASPISQPAAPRSEPRHVEQVGSGIGGAGPKSPAAGLQSQAFETGKNYVGPSIGLASYGSTLAFGGYFEHAVTRNVGVGVSGQDFSDGVQALSGESVYSITFSSSAATGA